MPTYFDTEVEQKLCLISDASLSIGQSRFVCAALITAHLTIRRKVTALKIDGTDVSKFGFKFAQSNAPRLLQSPPHYHFPQGRVMMS